MTPLGRIALGFDTSAAHCAAALVLGDRVLAERVEPMGKGQAERLMGMLEEVLAEAGLGWDGLDALGVCTGPGNFTGTRIGVAAARGLALALGIPAEGVGAAEALAEGRDVVVCLPAPRGQVHAAWRGEVRTVAPGAPPEGWDAPLTGPAANLLGGGRTVLPAPPIAVAVARMAAERAAPGRPSPAPVYLRPADAAPPSDPPPRILA